MSEQRPERRDDRRRERVVTMVAHAKPGAEPAEPNPPAIDWKAVRRRLRLIRAALDLPPDYVEEVVASLDRGDERQLIEFAERHGQSLEWIATGDLAPMLRKFAAGLKLDPLLDQPEPQR